MLGWMYSVEKLEEAIADYNQDFLVLENGLTILGFTGIEHHYQDKNITRIHKLYVLPETQGTGAGKALLEEIIQQAKLNHSSLLHLNVNKANKAVSFYEHVGFVVSDQEVLDIGNGFVMDDYIMTKEI
jgi:GNAT superfamily N-acetyltransferase